MEKTIFCLALERQKGDYKTIDINELIKTLGIPFGYVINEEWSIDSFTKLFTESEIKDTIKRSNMASEDYLNGNLKIVSNAGHSLPIITKNMFENYFKVRNDETELNINLKNKIFGIYKKIVESKFKDKDFVNGLLNRFKNALKIGNKKEIFSLIEMPEMDYHQIRPIYIAIMDNI